MYYISGGYSYDTSLWLEEILMFDKETRKFEKIGNLQQRRRSSSMTVVDVNDYACQ